MALWGNTDAATNAVVFRVIDKFVSGRNTTGASNAYANVTPSAFVTNQVVTVSGVDVTEATLQDRVVHPGWVVTKQGTGPVASATSSGGTGYANGDVLTVANGVVNATATVATNSTGGDLTFTFTNNGSGFINTSAVAITVANSTAGATGGSGATITVTLGGRAGRRHVETLVAMGTIGSDGGDDALFPDS
jgi:hypothetical protein